MDKKFLKRKTSENGGLLFLQGYGTTRAVFAFEHLIASGVDWGYAGDRCKALSRAILNIYLPEEEISKELVENFTLIIVQFIPSESFNICIKITELIQILTEQKKVAEIHAYEFLYVRMGTDYYSKFIDVVNMGAKCTFKSDSLEYKMLKELMPMVADNENINTYFKNRTKHTDHQQEQVIFAQVAINPISDNIVIDNCLGSGVYTGSDWHKHVDAKICFPKST